jgi:hypothetical protein
MRSSCRLCRAPSRRAKVKGANMTTIRTVDISDRDYEKIRSPLTTVLILSNDRGISVLSERLSHVLTVL